MNTIVLFQDLCDLSCSGAKHIMSAFTDASCPQYFLLYTNFTADQITNKHCLLRCNLVFKQIVDGFSLSVF